MPESLETTMTQEETAFADIIGDLVEQWGFKRHLGRVWSLLYMRQEPQSPSQIQTELSLSAGMVNGLLSELQMWGVVRRIRIAGDRNFYFEAQTQIWKSVMNVLRTRELRILEEAISGLGVLKTALSKHSSKDLSSFQLERLTHVRDAIVTASSVATLLVGAQPEHLAKIGKLITRLRSL